MKRPQFLLSSDQLELLLAFEESKGLGQLAETMHRDPSVISRSLQRIAEDYPVLSKIRGRWRFLSPTITHNSSRIVGNSKDLNSYVLLL